MMMGDDDRLDRYGALRWCVTQGYEHPGASQSDASVWLKIKTRLEMDKSLNTYFLIWNWVNEYDRRWKVQEDLWIL